MRAQFIRPIRHKTLPVLLTMVVAAGSPSFAGPSPGGLVLHTNQDRIVQHTNQDVQGMQGMRGMTGLLTVPRDHVPWLGPLAATDTPATGAGSMPGAPPIALPFDVPADVPADVWALQEIRAHGNSPRAVGSIPAPAALPVLVLALLARGGRPRRRLNRSCTMSCTK